MVGDGHFVDAHSLLGYLGGHLRFDPEPVLFEIESLKDTFAEDFIACFHIGQVEVGEHVREQGQEFITNRVPEIQHPVCLRANKA